MEKTPGNASGVRATKGCLVALLFLSLAAIPGAYYMGCRNTGDETKKLLDNYMLPLYSMAYTQGYEDGKTGVASDPVGRYRERRAAGKMLQPTTEDQTKRPQF